MILSDNKFWKKVNKTETCWLWEGCLKADGYGWLMRGKSINWTAHRYSWFIHNGEIPNNLHVLHKCDVRNCVNPNHLFLGTHQDNMLDMVQKKHTVRLSGEDCSFLN